MEWLWGKKKRENFLPSLIENYSAKNIFNTDKTGLFLPLLPDKTLNVEGELCNDGKMLKIQLTMLNNV